MEWRSWPKLLVIIILLVFLSGNTICQNIEVPFKADSIACDTFPPPRNPDGLTYDNTVMLWWEVPFSEVTDNKADSTIPQNLLAYFLIKDGELLDSIPFTGDDTSYYYDDLGIGYPTAHDYSVSALYDLSPCGFPGEVAESEYAGPVTFYGFGGLILPFIEDWTTGSFDPNLWTADDYWEVSGQSGHPAPTAVFSNWADSNYRQGVFSYWLDCRDHPGTIDPYVDGDIYLEFDIKLNDFTLSGTDFLRVELSDSIEWQTITEYSNDEGSFPWQYHKINITEQAKGEYIRIAFVAEGEDGTNIHSWYIDNIKVYRQCNPPLDLQWLVFDESMAWSPPIPHTSDQRMQKNSREMLGYNVYVDWTFLGFTTDTFYILDQSYGYGPYYVTAVYEDCEPASNPIYGPQGIDENSTNTEINIFPNPTKDKISIRSDKVITRIQLIKSDGVLILDRNYKNSLVSLPLDNYPAGIYLVKIYHDNAVISRKVLLEK